MEKKVVLRSSLEDILKLVEIDSEYVEVSYAKGIVIIQPKHLCCVQCGCTTEEKLIVRNGVHICTECIREMRDFTERTENL